MIQRILVIALLGLARIGFAQGIWPITSHYTAQIIDQFLIESTIIDPRTRFENLNLTLPPITPWPHLQTDMETPPDCGETSYVGSGRLRHRKALITGGDSGIGRATAIAFLREGADVAINYLPQEEPDAQDLANFLANEGRSIIRIPGDLLNETFCEELVAEADRRMGGLDIVINHAGYAHLTSAADV